ncbi:MAG TPA: alkaline phosphatase family protein, partial [bacterium]|nr:alkaline phosphatase family protein [bacterium]
RATTGFTYPAELEKELGEYPLDLFGESLPPGQEGRLLGHFRHTLDRHSEEAVRLLREEDWDLFWVVLTGTDKVQHFFWKFSDPQHPEYDPVMAEQFGSAVRDFWVLADRAVGELIAAAGPETDVLVVSDHGFGPIYRELKMWGWLRQEGFVESGGEGEPPSVEAFAPGAFGGLVRANVEGRDFGGQVSPEEAPEILRDIRRGLEELRDPVTGEPFVQEVHARDEIYQGPYVHNAPDLVFVEAPGRFIGRGAIASKELFGLPSYTFSAFHRPEGVLMAAGPHFAPDAERREYSILDLAPTLYWLFDVDAPNDLDGRVPPALVGADSLAARPPQTGDEAAVIPPRDAPAGEDREVLESLGYVR